MEGARRGRRGLRATRVTHMLTPNRCIRYGTLYYSTLDLPRGLLIICVDFSPRVFFPIGTNLDGFTLHKIFVPTPAEPPIVEVVVFSAEGGARLNDED